METSSTSHSVRLGTEARPSIPNGRSATRLPPTEVLGGVRRHGHTELHDSPPPCETAFSMWAEGVCEFQDFGISSRIFLTLEGIPRIPRIQVSSAILNPQLTRPTSSSRPLDAHRCPSGQRIRGLRGSGGARRLCLLPYKDGVVCHYDLDTPVRAGVEGCRRADCAGLGGTIARLIEI